MKPTGPTDPNLVDLIVEMKKSKNAFYLSLAKKLNSQRRKKEGTNVSKLNKVSLDGEKLAVPGKVLGEGEITKKLHVYAWSFSKEAKTKIEKAGGSCKNLKDLMKENTKARIVV